MSRIRLMRRLAIAFFALYAILVTFPGVVPFRGPRPFILGMPLSMVWISGWVIAGGVVLWLLDRAHRHSEQATYGEHATSGNHATSREPTTRGEQES